MEKNYKMLIAYDGSRYYGWQHQPDKITVQGEIENAIERFTGKRLEVIGAGRTDAGVHARGMTANVFLSTQMTDMQIRDHLNRYLPEDIAILEVREASKNFHARYSAVGKTYRYTLYYGEKPSVFERKIVTAISKKPDLEKMREAASLLMGEHDFKNFCINAQMKKSTVRIVDRIEIEEENNHIYLSFHGTGFLQNMVRIMVGTLLEVGYGKLSYEDIKNSLYGAESKKAGPTAAPEGLCLMEVDY